MVVGVVVVEGVVVVVAAVIPLVGVVAAALVGVVTGKDVEEAEHRKYVFTM